MFYHLIGRKRKLKVYIMWWIMCWSLVSLCFCTCLAAVCEIRPALHTLSVPKLVTHIVAEVVVSGATHFVALAAVVVFVAADADGVLEPGDGAFKLHRLLLLSGVDHPFVDASLDQQLLVWTGDGQMRCKHVKTETQHEFFLIDHRK